MTSTEREARKNVLAGHIRDHIIAMQPISHAALQRWVQWQFVEGHSDADADALIAYAVLRHSETIASRCGSGRLEDREYDIKSRYLSEEEQ